MTNQIHKSIISLTIAALVLIQCAIGEYHFEYSTDYEPTTPPPHYDRRLSYTSTYYPSNERFGSRYTSSYPSRNTHDSYSTPRYASDTIRFNSHTTRNPYYSDNYRPGNQPGNYQPSYPSSYPNYPRNSPSNSPNYRPSNRPSTYDLEHGRPISIGNTGVIRFNTTNANSTLSVRPVNGSTGVNRSREDRGHVTFTHNNTNTSLTNSTSNLNTINVTIGGAPIATTLYPDLSAIVPSSGSNNNAFASDEPNYPNLPDGYRDVSKGGSCPPPSPVNICRNTCLVDAHCEGIAKCCQTSCGGAVCTRPVTTRPDDFEKPGKCPAKPTGPWVCTSTCAQDSDCRGRQKCCKNRCGAYACQKPDV